MAAKWRLEGTIFDACNCTTLCPCNYFQNPTGPDCRATGVWHIEKGKFDGTKLDGLTLAFVLHAPGNPFFGIDRAAVVLDEKATHAQREALQKILGGQAGGLFAMLAKVLKAPPEIAFAKFEYANDGKAWSVRAGNTLEIRAGFVRAPPDFPAESTPKKAQTYDALFGPTMEKVVGISEKYRANIAGLNYDISGKYSSSGRFVYEGA